MKDYNVIMSLSGYVSAAVVEIPPGITFDKIVEDLKDVKRQLPPAPDTEHLGYKSKMLYDYFITTYAVEHKPIKLASTKAAQGEKFAVTLSDFGGELNLPSDVYIFAIRYDSRDNDEALVMRISAFNDKEVADLVKLNGLYTGKIEDPVSYTSPGRYVVV